jgi:hypothetical protein
MKIYKKKLWQSVSTFHLAQMVVDCDCFLIICPIKDEKYSFCIHCHWLMTKNDSMIKWYIEKCHFVKKIGWQNDWIKNGTQKMAFWQND